MAQQEHSFILIAAGGTGGHILPGIRVGEHLRSRHSAEVDVAYVCGTRPIEKEIFDSEGLAPIILPVGQNAGNPVKRAYQLTRALGASFRLLLKRRPAAVLAMGGAVCFPLLAAATMLRIPIFLHESNRIPGRVIRLFRKAARRVFLGLGGLEGENVVVTGTPTKPAQLGEAEPDVVFCVGGSQGASALNQTFVNAVEQHLQDLNLKFVLVAGPGKQVEGAKRVEVRGYEPNLPSLFQRAVLCVSRSGAGAMADIANFRTPSVLVPYPHAMDNHQVANARVYSGAGAAVLVEERDLTPARLSEEIRGLLSNPQRLEDMKKALASFDSSGAADLITREILQQIQHQPNPALITAPRKA